MTLQLFIALHLAIWGGVETVSSIKPPKEQIVCEKTSTWNSDARYGIKRCTQK
jgi:hypothetical protein